MSEFKRLVAFDGVDTEDSAKVKNWYDTEIIFRDPVTKEVWAKEKNQVVLAGGDVVARKLFDLSEDDTDVIPTYNEELAIPDPGEEDPDAVYDTKAKKNDPKVLLFCVGTDGCGTEGSQIFKVEYNSRIAPSAMIPFRYPMSTGDINEELQESYAGRKDDGTFVSYYFKKFTAGPTLLRKHADGTTIDHNVYESGLPVDCYVEITLVITKEELREFFIATVGLDQCRFNSLSLCTAYPKQVDGKTYYMDIKPFTKLHVSNEYMIDVSKGVEVIYHIYF